MSCAGHWPQVGSGCVINGICVDLDDEREQSTRAPYESSLLVTFVIVVL